MGGHFWYFQKHTQLHIRKGTIVIPALVAAVDQNPALVLVKQRSKMGDSGMGSGSALRTRGTLASHQEQLEILQMEVETRGGALLIENISCSSMKRS